MKNITTLAQLAVQHDYYCALANWTSKDSYEEYATFKEFYEASKDDDIDMNLVFRWDIKPHATMPDCYSMEIFMMQQRRGNFNPNFIRLVEEDDVPLIIKFLTPHFEKIQSIWKPF